MTRIHRGTSPDLEWINVSAGRHCPVCGATAGCKMHAEGLFAACGTQPSDWPMTSGAWLHRLEQPFARSSALKDAAPSSVTAAALAGTIS